MVYVNLIMIFAAILVSCVVVRTATNILNDIYCKKLLSEFIDYLDDFLDDYRNLVEQLRSQYEDTGEDTKE